MNLTIMQPFFIAVIFTLTCLAPCNAAADWSGNVSLANNYLFNGISQTDDDVALQAGITWSAENGLYLGSWASNIDYGAQANLEIDFYLGYAHSFNQQHSIDTGISQYTYHGSSSSEALNFSEFYLKYHFTNTSLSFWYSTDYFASGARHYIMMASHTFTFTEQLSVLISIDKSTSLDEEKWLWQNQDKDYVHGQITASFVYSSFDFSLGLHNTDLANNNDAKLLLSLSYSFG